MTFENHGGPCKSGCERIACMCAHEKLAREYRKLEAQLALARKWLAADLRLDAAIERELADSEYIKDGTLYGRVDATREAFRKAIEESK